MRDVPAVLVPQASDWAVRGLFVVGLVFLLKEAKPVLAPVVFAVVLTFVLAPGVRALRRRGVPEVIGAAILVMALLASVVPVAASLATPAAEWWERAPNTLSKVLTQLERLRAALPGLNVPVSQAPPAAVVVPRPRSTVNLASPAAAPVATPPPAPESMNARLVSEGVSLTATLLGRSATLAIAAASTVILLYFLLASEHWMLSRCVEAIPRRRMRAVVLGGVRAAQRDIGRFLLSLGVINFLTGLATGIAVALLGLPNPLLWGVVAGVLNFVPYIGPLAMVGLLLLAGVLSFPEMPAMAYPALVFMAIHSLEANVVTPWVVGRRLSLSPISVFLSVMFWGWIWGIAGALIAVPMLIGLRSVCRRNRRLRLAAAFFDGAIKRPPSLRSLLRVRRRPVALPTQAPPPRP